MTFGAKLVKLRKENDMTQEGLADALGVSRQSVSKWESDIAFPETEKLIRIGELFEVSLDYLLKDHVTEQGRREMPKAESFSLATLLRERKSEKMIWGMPLWHIGKNAHGFFALGVKASGVFAAGFLSKGLVSFGLLSVGLFSYGVLALGLLAAGVFAFGLLATGAIAVGVIAIGAVAHGLFSLGAFSVGQFAVGALAKGHYFAMGDHASAMVAIGETQADGVLWSGVKEVALSQLSVIETILAENTPRFFGWAKKLTLLFIR